MNNECPLCGSIVSGDECRCGNGGENTLLLADGEEFTYDYIFYVHYQHGLSKSFYLANYCYHAGRNDYLHNEATGATWKVCVRVRGGGSVTRGAGGEYSSQGNDHVYIWQGE